ncbi:S9 family peptidase [Allonocardiopsis opalescens]|uniref:Dipeptidyl-peptidase-4 n=1 Tax=Allonocardiopsis opalescens TaxID=1144618 RepID=A0A2T0QDK2_9ACTN|nr:prolyl oligopeptidase family serine peptidase [Allonocardiopsis opalescens]PRY01951.1 dipeptidyl-peptidase-4 [Allonocardiopsis opalescens]
MSFPRQQARTRRFSLGVPRAFQISADGSRVLFLRSSGGTDPVSLLWQLTLGDAGGTGAAERVVADPRLLGAGEEDLPPEERARRERMREQSNGIVSYTADGETRRAAFTVSGRLYVVDLLDPDAVPRELPAAVPVVNPVIDPTGRRVAYVSGRGLRVVEIGSGEDRAVASPDGPDVSWGLAEFIAAEEMGRFHGFAWSPDGEALLAARVDESPVRGWHIADPTFPDRAPALMRYPAAGTPDAEVTLAVFAAAAGAEAPALVPPADPELPYLADFRWHRTGPLVVRQSRDQRRVVVRHSPGDGGDWRVRELADPDWVELVPGLARLSDSGRLWWVGDSGGDRRLHLDDEAVTPDGLQVRGVLDVDGETVLFSGSTEPTETHLWTHGPGGLVRLTEEPGVHTGRLRASTVVVSSRVPDEPGVRTSVRRGGAEVAVIASHAERPELPPAPVRLVRLGARELRTAVVLPSWHEPGSGPLPVLMDPYGGPHAQRAVASGGAHLTSRWFAEQGFAVVVADGRGTPGRGSAWERAVRGDLAGPVLADQVDALLAAAERFPDLDLSRVGVRGWSFGGYLAALAVLRRPDVFHAAVAGAPVTDWRLYDTHYTERYLGRPDEHPDAYERSSLLADAARLRRPLMLIHGLADDNVVAAHTLRLSGALLAAGRPHTVLPLSGVTHMTPQETVAENLLLLQADFLREALAAPAAGA